MIEKNICRCCKGENLLLYLNLGKQPLANSYHKNEKLPKYELAVKLCRDCFHSQLTIVVDPEKMFKNYLYVSGTTKTFQDHTRKLAADAVGRVNGTKKIKVLDIACNDGTQLEYFRKLGCEVLGVDPAENLREITKQKKIPVHVEYWKPKLAKKMGTKFHIITGTNVFAHVDNLDEFLDATKLVLHKDGILILEFPYADNMVTHTEFDTIYHEHLSYFLVNSFATLASRKGFQIIDVKLTSIHGGSIRFFLKSRNKKHVPIVGDLIKDEQKTGLLNEKTYLEFAEKVKRNKKDIKKLFAKFKNDEIKIVGYAASAKGNTMLNYFHIKPVYIVDDNPLKWGYKTPGMNIPIVSPDILANDKNNLGIIILAWNFYNEIASRILKVRPKKKDYGIVYVPFVQTLSLREHKRISVSA